VQEGSCIPDRNAIRSLALLQATAAAAEHRPPATATPPGNMPLGEKQKERSRLSRKKRREGMPYIHRFQSGVMELAATAAGEKLPALHHDPGGRRWEPPRTADHPRRSSNEMKQSISSPPWPARHCTTPHLPRHACLPPRCHSRP
jgi:hypothetical protein